MKNYYEILEVPVSACPQEIQKAYQQLSEKYHPENNGGVTFFNEVYNQIQKAYKVLFDETLKAEYNRKNNISISGESSINKANPLTYKSRKTKREELNSKKPKDKSFRFLITALTAIFIIAIGYFIYQSLPSDANEIPERENEIGFDLRNSNEENLKSLLNLESSRDFNIISTFYSKNVVRYWNSANIDKEGLKEQYKIAWNNTSNSKNNILDIEKVDNNNLIVETEFSYVDNGTNKTVSNNHLNRYIFNNHGLITQVYNINTVKEYEENSDTILVKSPEISEKKISQSPEIVRAVPVKNNINEEGIKDVPFAIIEEVPIFPGCEEMINNLSKKKCMSEKVQEFINQRFNTDLGSQLGLTGVNRIIVQFKIDKEGNVTDVRSSAPHPGLEQEAARVINSLPKMIPGKQQGKTVGVMYSLPIVFQVQE